MLVEIKNKTSTILDQEMLASFFFWQNKAEIDLEDGRQFDVKSI